MKTRIFFLSGVIASAIVLVFLFFPKEDGTPVRSIEMRQDTPRKSANSKKSSSYLVKPQFAIDLVAPLGGPARRAVRNTLARNPALELSPEDVERLEQSFVKHYSAFSLERNRAVTGEATGVDSYEIQIPSCPEIGLRSLNAFLQEVQTLNIGDSNVITPIAKKMFEGYTEQAGRNGVTYSIQFKENSGTLVKYTREVAIVDPVTGKVTGTGVTYGEIDLKDADPVLVTAIEKANNKR